MGNNYWEDISEKTALLNSKEFPFFVEDSNPTDYIILTLKNHEILKNYVSNNFQINNFMKMQKIPGDIFKSQNIPLPDIVFKSTIWSDDFSRKTLDLFVRCVVIDNQLILILDAKHYISNEESIVIIMTKQSSNDDDPFVTIDSSHIYLDNYDTYDIIKDRVFIRDMKTSTLAISNTILIDWYAIQTMMLNPIIKDTLLVKGPKEKIRVSSDRVIKNTSSNKTRKRKAPFIKYSVLNSDILESDVIRKRHTMCWYVMGHWRKHGTGKVWVNGYWKGPLRKLKKNLDSGREIVIEQG